MTEAVTIPEPPQRHLVPKYRDDITMDLSDINFMLMLIPSVNTWKMFFTLVELMDKNNQIIGYSRKELSQEAGLKYSRGMIYTIMDTLKLTEMITIDTSMTHRQTITVSSDFVTKSTRRRRRTLND